MRRNLEKARRFEQKGRGRLARDPEKGLKRGPWRRSEGREGMASMAARQTADVEVPLPPAKKRAGGLRRRRRSDEDGLTGAERRVARALRLAFKQHARSQPCAQCGRRHGDRVEHGRRERVEIEAHHALEKRALKDILDAAGVFTHKGRALDRLRVLWDVRNCMPLCDDCHDRHHDWVVRLTRATVLAACPRLEEFAAELGAGWLLDRTYPAEAAP